MNIKKPILIIICGLPGSGKSEIAKSLVGAKGIIHSTDNYHIKNGKIRI